MLAEDIYRLIIGKLTHGLTEEEEAYLSRWISQDKKNQRIFDDYSRLLIEIRQIYRIVEPDVEACLRELPIHTPFNVRRLFRYAAVLLFLLTLALGGYLWKKEENRFVADKNDTLSSRHIQLVLASGEVLDLPRKGASEIVRRQGIGIYHSGDTLDYSGIDHSADSIPVFGQPQYNTLIIPRGAEYYLVLADGTEVWLNAESELKYPVCFSGSQRQVFLKGEAYFHVAPNRQNPFYVKTSGIAVKVLGTSFNVMAYNDTDCVETTLEQGEIEIQSGEENVTLQPGMQAIFSKETHTFRTRYVNTSLYTSWKDNLMVFEKIRLEELLEKLSRWYDVNIFYLNPECKEIILTGNIIRHENIGTILRLLETMGKVEFSVQQKTITVMKAFE